MTTTSRVRRAAVAAAMQDVDRRWLRDYRATPTRYEAMADAAIAACLPDRDTFLGLLNHCMVWNGLIAVDETDTVAVMMRDEAIKQLLALVYGADAQDGDQEGAEHGS